MVSIELTLIGIGPIAEEATISITDGIVLLYGPNGAGKSTIMRALAYALSALMGYEVQVGELMEMVNKERRVGEIRIKIDGSRYSISIDASNKEIIVKRGDEELTRIKITTSVGIVSIPSLQRIYPILQVKPMGVIKVLGLTDEIRSQIESFRDLLLPGTVEKVLSSRLIISSSEIAKVYSEYLDAVNTALNYVVNYDLKLVGDVPYFVDLSRNLTHYIKYEYVADGVKQALTIITAAEFAELLRRYGSAPILLIDDVETALHYDYLISLLQYLAKRQYPVILETHNSLALRYVYDNKLRFYVVEGGKAFTDIKSSSLFKREVIVYSM
ncbi:hypothetical protein VMUT_1481 [Vulcanisaeta moutnovskia 768-28]|uniref:AAA+ ATPase domain-containing protein n=1 Tax=Vulcanisaeta moutnovskia (strain 768-28) TaxID=985053 RepID=F0QTH3_VULM7|nr:AAA family ATPase [Vulcanisaeta moutnovskia]ADY01686.1 hypothetical protein VMUT_1481 [Vulcanisaeta moutnovskia 768-28]